MTNKLKKQYEDIDLSGHLEELGKAQTSLLQRTQARRTYIMDEDDCPDMDFSKGSLIEYIDNVFVEDLSVDRQVQFGLNVFYVKIDKTTHSPLHKHESRAQLIHVLTGSIYDRVSKMRFEAGENFFISKRNRHAIKYIKGSRILFIHVPGLNFK